MKEYRYFLQDGWQDKGLRYDAEEFALRAVHTAGSALSLVAAIPPLLALYGPLVLTALLLGVLLCV